MKRVELGLEVNGRTTKRWVWPHQTLLEVLHDEIGATEVKYGCGEGVCGTCTVLLNGEPVNACLVFGVQAQGASVTTVRGLSSNGDMHALQQSFLENGAAQCGFCTPGMLLVAYAHLRENPSPNREEIREALAGNLCRCTGYSKILDAAESYAAAAQEDQP